MWRCRPEERTSPVQHPPEAPAIVWLRDDLRIADNPALNAAVERGGAVLVLFVLDEVSDGIRGLGGASRWWLHQSLTSLGASLAELGVPLVLRRGAAAEVVPAIVAETGASAVFWNRRYGGAARAIDTELKTTLRAHGLEVASFAASLLFEPWTISTGAGGPYSVFTPFWKASRDAPPPRGPLPAPTAIEGYAGTAASDAVEDWALEPTHPDWAGGLREAWTPGEAAASAALDDFLATKLAAYAGVRDFPAEEATSRLSPHLRFGEISPYTVWDRATRARAGLGGAGAEGTTRFLTELGWREFTHHVLFHAPELATVNWRREFDAFPWPPLDESALVAWQKGRTGLPIVDAGMRELWTTGTMHNRIRMVVASFLTKNLLIDWRLGEQWFWDTLVDADEASNPFNWQWVAGSGADAAPYFRVFNPELQAKKFDGHGQYVKHWVPEVGTDAYPEPIVDLGETRRAALAAYDVVKNQPR
ncbi:deoxyribodipyrimidine photolyase [Leifsonia sp. Leaf325]|nr:deoxyribodipyrimidine photolyase [Leifsonia sp. Leaf325]